GGGPRKPQEPHYEGDGGGDSCTRVRHPHPPGRTDLIGSSFGKRHRFRIVLVSARLPERPQVLFVNAAGYAAYPASMRRGLLIAGPADLWNLRTVRRVESLKT